MKLLDALKAAATIAWIAVAAGVFLLLLQISSFVRHKDVETRTAIAQMGGAAGKLSATLDSVNRLCPGPKDPARPCGVLADLNRTLATFRGVGGQVEIAAIHENRQLSTLDAQEATLAGDLHQAIRAGTSTATELSQTATELSKTADAATLAIGQGTTTMAAEQPRLDALIQAATTAVANPDVPILIHHAAGITASGDEIAKDAADKLHQYTHPNKRRATFWGGADAFMLYLHSRVIPPIL